MPRSPTPLRFALFLLAAILPLASCAERSQPQAEAPPATESPLITQTATVRAADLEFDAVIDAPAPARRNGWGVLMIGGGFGNDLDWTVPGSIVVEGQTIQTSISGQAHADGPAISAALAERGFVVMRWTTIARNDPLADQWPARATTRPLSEMVEHTRAALETLRACGLIDPARVILLGHSLGAARACTIAAEDEGVRGLVLLAPAYFTRDEKDSLAASAMRYGEDVLRKRPIPCLALFGALDTSRAVNATAATALAGAPGFERLQSRTLPDLGHQLGPTEETRHGPIDPQVLIEISNWADQIAHNSND